jgi:hypothetical protein
MSRGIRLTVDTQEDLTAEQKAEVFNLYENLGWFFFLKEPTAVIKRDELPEIRLEKGEKSPGQRLRAALYVYWEQRTDKKDDFELFYRRWMERAIDGIKEMLV